MVNELPTPHVCGTVIVHGPVPLTDALPVEHVPLPEVAAQHHHLVLGPKRRRQQAVGVQPLNPLAIEHVGLGSARGVLRLPWIDQINLEAAPLEQLEQRNPVNAGRFHSHAGDAALLQPVGQQLQVRGAGAELAHVWRQLRSAASSRVRGLGRRHVIGRHGHPVHRRVHVDTRCMRIGHAQRLRRRDDATIFLPARSNDGLLG